ncbi:MAG TPA: carboxypeptidase regulatory-like domain-containing protein [Pyrinomonadaceae bacterium]|jgi:hypothetical protein
MREKIKALRKPTRFALRALAACAALCSLALTSGAASKDEPKTARQERPQETVKRLGIRLRSFVPGASASMYFEPTLSGGNVRLLVLGLPEPRTLMPDARTYVVWAVASGEHPIRVGEVQTDESGSGGLEFGRPAQFERYSVIVTAEPSTSVENPAGIMVLASRAGAVTSFFGQREQTSRGERLRRLSAELGRRSRVRPRKADFFAEVDNALNDVNGGRTLELYGDEVTPEAHGLARITSRERKAYARVVFNNFPQPFLVGANVYVLWSILPDGRIVYMGSLPTNTDLNETDIYVRVGGVATDEFELFVTAENRRPVARPSGRRAVSSISQLDLASQFGAIEGRVVDNAGRGIAGAVITAIPLDQSGMTTQPVAHADPYGRFLLIDLPPGSYMLYAAKEEAGYLGTSYSFFVVNQATIPRASVAAQQITQDIVLQLGAKAARLVGRVLDATNGTPVENAEMMLIRADDPNNYHLTGPNKTGGIFQLIVPTVPFKIRVSARGYRDWYYGADGTKERSGIMRIEPDTTRELIVPLQPLK